MALTPDNPNGIFERSRANAAGAWVSYTPTWTNGGQSPAPSIGNGSLSGKYTLIGKTCYVQVAMAIGNTTTLGNTGSAWFWSLPTAANDANYTGVCRMLDSGTAHYMGAVAGNTTYAAVACHGAGYNLYPQGPFNWTTGDVVYLSFFYDIP